jgi:hypothetical protein
MTSMTVTDTTRASQRFLFAVTRGVTVVVPVSGTVGPLGLGGGETG